MFVIGEVNPGALEDLVRLCVQLGKLRDHSASGPGNGSSGNCGSGGHGDAVSDSDGTDKTKVLHSHGPPARPG